MKKKLAEFESLQPKTKNNCIDTYKPNMSIWILLSPSFETLPPTYSSPCWNFEILPPLLMKFLHWNASFLLFVNCRLFQKQEKPCTIWIGFHIDGWKYFDVKKIGLQVEFNRIILPGLICGPNFKCLNLQFWMFNIEFRCWMFNFDYSIFPILFNLCTPICQITPHQLACLFRLHFER